MSREILELINKRKEILKQRKSIREAVKRKKYSVSRSKPRFLRWLWWKFPKFENNLKWKKPKGKDNPMRLRLKGYPPLASMGYGTKSNLRSLHPSGLKPVVIHSVKELETLVPSRHIVYISSTLGLKKRLEIIEKAKVKGLKVANL